MICCRLFRNFRFTSSTLSRPISSIRLSCAAAGSPSQSTDTHIRAPGPRQCWSPPPTHARAYKHKNRNKYMFRSCRKRTNAKTTKDYLLGSLLSCASESECPTLSVRLPCRSRSAISHSVCLHCVPTYPKTLSCRSPVSHPLSYTLKCTIMHRVTTYSTRPSLRQHRTSSGSFSNTDASNSCRALLRIVSPLD
jgi:hypothetical protein